MREVQTVELGDVKLEVKELTVAQILQFYDDFSKMDDVDSIKDGTKDYLRKIYDLSIGSEQFTFDDMMEKLTPSEIKQIFEAFKGANKVFFEVSQSLGIMSALEGLVAEIRKDFIQIFADSSNEVTETS